MHKYKCNIIIGKTNNGFIAEPKENGVALQDIKSPNELNGTAKNTKEGTSNGTAVKMPEEKENRDDKALKTSRFRKIYVRAFLITNIQTN